jgi:hypothetical protein
MNARRVIYSVLLAILATIPAQAVSGEPRDEANVRRVWNARQRQVQAALYRVTWVNIRFNERGSERNEGSMEALMAFDKWTYRFDVSEGREPATVLVLDKTGFHARPPADHPREANEDATRLVTPASPWILAYPLLLSHGIVPMPPFSHEGMMRTRSTPKRGRILSSERSLTTLKDFRWFAPREDVEVRVQSPEGLVSRFQVYRESNQVLNISISYGKRKDVPVADRYSIEWFAADGKVEHRVDAQVKIVTLNEPIAAALFAPPHTPEELLAALARHWDKELEVRPEMSVDEIATLLQQTVGDAMRVHVDQEAFQKPIEFEAKNLTFDGQRIRLADLMLGKLQSNALDFLFDSHGVTIVPRHVAWQSPEGKTYSAKDYGLSVDELRDALYEAGTPDEWEDVGGPAAISIDHEDGSVFIMHTPSEQIRLSRALQSIAKEGKK